MVGQMVKLNFPADHQGAPLNGTLGRTVAYEAASVERPYGRFQVEFVVDRKLKKLKPENLQPVAPRPIPQRPVQLSKRAIDFPGSHSSSSGEPETTFALAIEWLEEKDALRGYVAMEKYDGVRAMWEGGRGGFRTRGGKPDKALQPFPPSITKLLPKDMRLDGEIWSQRGDFEGATCFRPAFHTLHTGSPAQIEERWANLSFKVYDAPSVQGPFLERLEAASKALSRCAESAGSVASDTARVHVVQTTRCEDAKTARDLLTRVESFGGEGLILRDRHARHHVGRDRDRKGSRTPPLLKVKSLHDTEAKLVERVSNKDSWWASDVDSGTLFKVSSNNWTVKLGDVITYSYMGLVHADGGPRFPSIRRVHNCQAGECDACALSRGEVPGKVWPVSADWCVGQCKTELVRPPGWTEG